MSKKRSHTQLLSILAVAVVLSLVLYMTINTRGNWAFAFMLRRKRLIPFILTGVTTTVATIVFQTMTQNTILTPSIIGLDSLYVLLQTAVIFFLSTTHTLSTHDTLNFIVSLLLMIGASALLYTLFFKRYPGRLGLMLMVGLIMGTFFSSVTTFLQVLIDPNEFDSVFARTVASFSNVDASLTILSLVISVPILISLFSETSRLDVLHLGRAYAMGLGIHVDRYYLYLFMLISILTAVSTAMVGPVSFLGFIGANVSYKLFNTYKHSVLFIGGSLLSILLIVSGQLVVEHVFRLRTTLGVIIQFVGGIYFLFILMKERSMHP